MAPLALASVASAEPTTTTTAPPTQVDWQPLLDDEGVTALGMVVAFGLGALTGQTLWGRP